MKQPPRNIQLPLFTKSMILLSIGQGLTILFIVTFLYGALLHLQIAVEIARSFAFVTLIFANINLILVNRSWKYSILKILKVPNKILWSIIISAICVLLAVLYVPLLRQLFKFGTLNLLQVIFCLLIGITSVQWFEFFKWLHFRGNKK